MIIEHSELVRLPRGKEFPEHDDVRNFLNSGTVRTLFSRRALFTMGQPKKIYDKDNKSAFWVRLLIQEEDVEANTLLRTLPHD